MLSSRYSGEKDDDRGDHRRGGPARRRLHATGAAPYTDAIILATKTPHGIARYADHVLPGDYETVGTLTIGSDGSSTGTATYTGESIYARSMVWDQWGISYHIDPDLVGRGWAEHLDVQDGR